MGWSLSAVASPSIVSTSAPSACSASMVHDLTALPSTWTTQQPHWEVSQPTCVPVRRNCSRKSCTSRVRGSTVALTGLPFTVSETAGIGDLLIGGAPPPYPPPPPGGREGGGGPQT